MGKKSKRVFILAIACTVAIIMLFSFFLFSLSEKRKKESRDSLVLNDNQTLSSSEELTDDPFENISETFAGEKTVEDSVRVEEVASGESDSALYGIEEKSEKQNTIEYSIDEGSEEAQEEQELKEAESEETNPKSNTFLLDYSLFDLSSIPEYTHEPYVELNNNFPAFSEKDKKNPTFEYYSPLDNLGRCGVASANLAKELMPTTERGPMGHIKPTGWHTVKYPEQIGDVYLFNRCHLIAFSLAGENDNVQNLITGTRFMNVSGMLPFEKEVGSYIDTTNNHVLYRVIPYFSGNELVARGVQMEAFSLEDNGSGICFNVFVYNVQPGIGIDYSTGESWVIE